ncbi:MAG: hypothetical protein DI546_09255 [Rhizobium sp.]|nr:MAG: hypothetical protein DI546_09255 [Rhizobium sp.]
MLPGRNVTAGDGWLIELPGLIVDIADPLAYRWTKVEEKVPLRVSVTMLCGCAISQDGPWRASDTEVDAFVTSNGGAPRRIPLRFDPASSLFTANVSAEDAGLYEVEVRAWIAASNNAGVARTAFFVR